MEKILQLHQDAKLPQHPWVGVHYYTRPDGQDLIGKLFFTSKIGGTVGLICGGIAANMEPIPKTLEGKFIKMGRILIPALGMAATFTFVTYFSTVFRKKDDQLNHFFGALAAGISLYPLTGWRVNGVYVGLCLAPIAAIIKNEFMKPVNERIEQRRYYYPNYFRREWNTSGYKEEKAGNWTK